MAMTAVSMATQIVNKIKIRNPDITGTIETDLLDYWTDICTGIVAEIQTNALVNVASVTAVTPGAGTSGPGTGTIT